jgi:hypothetical protein
VLDSVGLDELYDFEWTNQKRFYDYFVRSGVDMVGRTTSDSHSDAFLTSSKFLFRMPILAGADPPDLKDIFSS